MKNQIEQGGGGGGGGRREVARSKTVSNNDVVQHKNNNNKRAKTAAEIAVKEEREAITGNNRTYTYTHVRTARLHHCGGSI